MTAAIFALLALGVYLHAQKAHLQPPSPNSYDGPRDEIHYFWKDAHRSVYGEALLGTTLGPLARYSDIIGVGHVSQRGEDHFTVTIDHALVGCTNGAVIVVYDGYDEGRESVWPGMEAYFPTNLGRIVFAAHTNVYNGGWGRMFWNHAEIPREPWEILERPSLSYLNRSWWYVDRDDGLLFTQFTNVLQAVRFDRNWTNYLHLCRDGANSPSNRVREDSFWDLRSLVGQTTETQMQFILADPLIDQKHKNWRLSAPHPYTPEGN